MQTPQTAHELEPVAEWVDHLFSGLIVSGGSAAAIKLFQDVMGLGKASRDASREAQEVEDQARKAEAELQIAKLQIETTQLRERKPEPLIR